MSLLGPLNCRSLTIRVWATLQFGLSAVHEGMEGGEGGDNQEIKTIIAASIYST